MSQTGHPKGLYTLFFTEMWERFGYYGMRALLTLFLMASFADGGFGMDKEAAFKLYGIFTALVYVTPMIGGVVADKLLGQRVTIYIGGLVMALGHFTLAFSAFSTEMDMAARQFLFNVGLGILIVGNGFFKPNISTMVGAMYDNNDPRKDGGFTIFYMGINIGAMIAPFVAGYLGESIAWHWGYMSAGVGMLFAVLWMFIRETTLKAVGLPLKSDSLAVKKDDEIRIEDDEIRIENGEWIKILGYTVGLVALIYGLMLGWAQLSETVAQWIMYLVGSAGVIYLGLEIYIGTTGKTAWGRMVVILVLALFNIFFWVAFEQAGTSFTLFARDNTDRMIMGWEMPASWFQSVNAVFIVLLAPLFSILWLKLDKIKLNPNTPMKFAWGMGLLAAGCAVMAVANDLSVGGGSMIQVSPLWLTAVYLLFTLGELCISPVGLSMITKLAPEKLGSTMMGVWMASFAVGNFVAAQFLTITNGINEGREEPISMFWLLTIIVGVVGGLLVITSPKLKKLMGGVK